jgi:hypothetical protein
MVSNGLPVTITGTYAATWPQAQQRSDQPEPDVLDTLRRAVERILGFSRQARQICPAGRISGPLTETTRPGGGWYLAGPQNSSGWMATV